MHHYFQILAKDLEVPYLQRLVCVCVCVCVCPTQTRRVRPACAPTFETSAPAVHRVVGGRVETRIMHNCLSGDGDGDGVEGGFLATASPCL